MNKSELDYIAERTRDLLATQWAHRQILSQPALLPGELESLKPFVDHAVEKGWLNRKGEVLSVGFKTAAAYLRR